MTRNAWLLTAIALLVLAQGSNSEDNETAILQEVAAAAGGQESLLRWALGAESAGSRACGSAA